MVRRFSVNVTNTGSVDADDVVLGFLTPPGAGEDGVPLQSLFGFGDDAPARILCIGFYTYSAPHEEAELPHAQLSAAVCGAAQLLHAAHCEFDHPGICLSNEDRLSRD